MLKTSNIGDLVAAEMASVMQSDRLFNKEASASDAVIEKGNKLSSIQDLIYTLNKVSSELDEVGLPKSSIVVLSALEVLISEADSDEILEQLGLESDEEDNLQEALERNPELARDFREELEMDPDIEPEDASEEPSPRDELEEMLSKMDEEDESSMPPEERREEFIELMQEWEDEPLPEELKVDTSLDQELDLDLDLKDLLSKEEDLDNHLIDMHLDDSPTGFEDEE